MESRFFLRTLLFLILVNIVIGLLQIPLEIEKSDGQLDSDIQTFFDVIDGSKEVLRCYAFITYTGSFDLKPSLEQRLMKHFSVPMYSVGSKNGPLNHSYPVAGYMVIILFSGLDDPTLAALNDTELSGGSLFFSFLYVPPRNASRVLTTEEMRGFFTWCWERGFTRAFLNFRGKFEFETLTYFFDGNVTITRLTEKSSYENVLRRHGFRFLVQVTYDPPIIYSKNSTEQADVIAGGNVSLSGTVGILMVEFMRRINATMDILPALREQRSNYEITEVPHRSVDLVANPVENGSLLFSPMVSDAQICLLVPHRRKVPFNRYFIKAMGVDTGYVAVPLVILVFAVKYISHRRRSLVDSFFSTLRFSLGIPLPGGRLQRLPLSDKIIEVYCMMVVGIIISTYSSIFSSVLTTGMYDKPITDVESLRASGLRIMTHYLTIEQAFRENRLPSSLLDLVDFVDEETFLRHLLALNDSCVYVIRTTNWRGFHYYQDRLKKQRLGFGGPNLCSSARQLRFPISPKSPLRFIFKEFFQRVVESGLHKKWQPMVFDELLKIRGVTQLPRDTEEEWRPLNLSFYSAYFKIYLAGKVLSILVFIIELIYERYRG